MRTWGVALIGLGVAAALTGCSGIETGTEASPETSSAPSADAGGEPVECEAVSDDLLAGIASGAVGTEITPVEGAAYRSPDHEELYLVAMRFDAPGIEGSIGIWATNSLTNGLTFSADSVAREFTDWPNAEEGAGDLQPNIAPGDPLIAAAESCLE